MLHALPKTINRALRKQLQTVEELHQRDLDNGLGYVYLPDALSRKYPNAAKELKWTSQRSLSGEVLPV